MDCATLCMLATSVRFIPSPDIKRCSYCVEARSTYPDCFDDIIECAYRDPDSLVFCLNVYEHTWSAQMECANLGTWCHASANCVLLTAPQAPQQLHLQLTNIVCNIIAINKVIATPTKLGQQSFHHASIPTPPTNVNNSIGLQEKEQWVKSTGVRTPMLVVRRRAQQMYFEITGRFLEVSLKREKQHIKVVQVVLKKTTKNVVEKADDNDSDPPARDWNIDESRRALYQGAPPLFWPEEIERNNLLYLQAYTGSAERKFAWKV
ncbi:hypothetical protein TELCIR_02005 [Teladorsagia circumcincta]|uniref:Uncharacterized protein n=1 Tax=Teladorsagia circumcincta TaxID=45464 RepID=A0A2G9V0D1_TELCI|nr:hypothetical protein TELCIR_02005 [Teladorsagia circumcincta]